MVLFEKRRNEKKTFLFPIFYIFHCLQLFQNSGCCQKCIWNRIRFFLEAVSRKRRFCTFHLPQKRVLFYRLRLFMYLVAKHQESFECFECFFLEFRIFVFFILWIPHRSFACFTFWDSRIILNVYYIICICINFQQTLSILLLLVSFHFFELDDLLMNLLEFFQRLLNSKKTFQINEK